MSLSGHELKMRAHEILARPRVQLVLLLGSCVALHAWHLAHALRDPYLQHRVVDEAFFHSWGSAIASGTLTSDLPFFTSPLFAYWLGLIYTVAGDSVATVVVANAILGVATVALTWEAARRIVGLRAALLAGILVAACRAPMFYVALPEKSALVLFLTALCIFSFAWAEERPGSRRFVVAGVAAGAAALAHPLMLLMAPAVAVHVLAKMRGARHAVLPVVLYAAGALAAVLPATVHNFAKSGEGILVCWNGGAALYAGNQSWNRSGTYAPPPFSSATIQSEIFDYWREAERRVGHPMRPGETSAFWTREALREMWKDPALTAERFVRRLHWTFGDDELQDSRTFSFYAERLPSLRFLPWGFGVVALLGSLAGLAAARDRRVVFLLVFIGPARVTALLRRFGHETTRALPRCPRSSLYCFGAEGNSNARNACCAMCCVLVLPTRM
jgi:4-amino-4-deoxy-L-arabinose transferase-like glycosyltransferase